MLSVDDLPRFVKMYDQNVQIEFLELEMKLVRLRDGDPLLRNIIPDSDNVLFLLFVGGNTTAIMSLQIFCYVFHSHSRDERGLNIPNGRSVLLNFRYIFEIEKYIQVAYLEFRDKQQMYFQAQFIRLKTEAIDMLSIFSKHKNSIRHKSYQNNSANVCKRKRKIHSENIGTSLYDKLKAKKRLHYKQVCVRENKSPAQRYGNMQVKRKVRERYLKTNMDSQIAADFKNQIK